MIQPWLNNGKIDDMNQEYVRFITKDSNVWQDGKNDPGWVHSSVCEIVLTPTEQLKAKTDEKIEESKAVMEA